MTGRTWKAKNARSRLRPPATPGRTAARVPQFHRQTEDAERQQQIRNLRVGDCAEEPLPPRHVDRPQIRLARLQHRRPAIEPLDGAAVELSQQIVHVRCDHVDERRRGARRLRVGEGTTLQDRLLGEGDVSRRASASDRTYAAVSEAAFLDTVSSIF